MYQDLCDFIGKSPTPFHATTQMVEKFKKAGFFQLEEGEDWQLLPGKSYFVVRNGASIIAFNMGEGVQKIAEHGFSMAGAHTDSPALKVRPCPDIGKYHYFQLGVEVYGGVLLGTWFDRDLALAGKVVYKNNKGELKTQLWDSQKAIGIIPNLAIHLNRGVNEKRSINPQLEMIPLIGQSEKPCFNKYLLKELQGGDAKEILAYDLFFYDTQKPAPVGINKEFVASARLDNLASCFAGMKAIIDSNAKKKPSLLICNDHEEVGSRSFTGAQGPFLKDVLRKIMNYDEALFQKMLRNSLLISADNAHGIHPNYPDRHDSAHAPLLNAGPVIKVNADQSYATHSEIEGYLRLLASEKKIPLQSFICRSDMRCGSTIGPITSAIVGVRTLDIGLPTFGMHSIRELAGSKDINYLVDILSLHFSRESSLS